MQLEYCCPNCDHLNYVQDDWDTCLQLCECCGSENEVVLEIKSVKTEIKKDLDKSAES